MGRRTHADTLGNSTSEDHTDIELRSTTLHTNSQSVGHDGLEIVIPLEHGQSELRSVDGGRAAWQLLISAFIFEALFWGFATAYGVFQAYYSTLPQFAAEQSNIAVIGTLAQGLAYLGAPFSAYLTKRFPRHQKAQLLIGWALSITGLLTASFADNVITLIMTQGFIYGIGFVIHTYPILNMINEWWITRKGMAFGMISAASGLTGIAMPLILEALLQRYGYKTTLRACAIAMLVLTVPLIPLLKGRLPLSEIGTRPKTNWSFLRSRLFYFYGLAITAQGFGFFIPPVFISSYAVGLGLPSTQAAALLAVMSLFQTIGQFAFGWLSDKKLHVSLLGAACCVVPALATLTLWGLGKNLGLLMVYSVFYGFFAFAINALRVAFGRAVTQDQSAVMTTYSIFVFLQGIGNVMVGPVAAALMRGSFDAAQYGASKYKDTIIFASSSLMLGAALMVAPHAFKAMSTTLLH